MSKAIKTMKRAILFLLISSLLLLCAIFVDIDNPAVRIITNIGAFFVWVFLILGYISFFRFSRFRKEQEKNNRSVTKKSKPGIIVFFSNPDAKKADIAMILSFVISIALTLIKMGIKTANPLFSSMLYESISVLAFAVFTFTFQMHAILNGVNYRYYLSLVKVQKDRKAAED